MMNNAMGLQHVSARASLCRSYRAPAARPRVTSLVRDRRDQADPAPRPSVGPAGRPRPWKITPALPSRGVGPHTHTRFGRPLARVSISASQGDGSGRPRYDAGLRDRGGRA